MKYPLASARLGYLTLSGWNVLAQSPPLPPTLQSDPPSTRPNRASKSVEQKDTVNPECQVRLEAIGNRSGGQHQPVFAGTRNGLGKVLVARIERSSKLS